MPVGFTDSVPVPQRLLVVGGDPALREQLQWGPHELEVFHVDEDRHVLAAMRQHEPQVVLVDFEGGVPAAQLLEWAAAAKVIVLAGPPGRDRAGVVEAGVWGSCQKPVHADALRLLVQRAFEAFALEQELQRLRDRGIATGLEGIVAVDRAMQGVCRVIEKVAPARVAVLIQGESGTGKELLARVLHNLSDRADRRFMAVSCSAIPGRQLEAELFGHGNGARGSIEQADGGTLFLDDVADMPLPLQARLMRLLQTGTMERAADHREVPVDVRLVSSTSRNLEEMLAAQRFHHELFFRLSEVTVVVPSLRERPGDILALAQAILVRQARVQGKSRRGFTDDAIRLLATHNWPGNVRELETKVKVACLLGDDALVSAADLGLAAGNSVGLPLNLKEVRNRAERDAVGRAMIAAGGNISRAAEMLGVSRPTLYDLLARHELAPAERRDAHSSERAGGVA